MNSNEMREGEATSSVEVGRSGRQGIEHVAVISFPNGRLNTKNAAAYCGLSPGTMANYRISGNGPKFSKKGRVFYRIVDLDEWLSGGGTFTSTAQARLAGRTAARTDALSSQEAESEQTLKG